MKGGASTTLSVLKLVKSLDPRAWWMAPAAGKTAAMAI